MKTVIEEIVENPVAIVGVSRDEKKWGAMLYKDFKEGGFNVVPVNPNLDKVGEDVCYKDVNDLPGNVKTLIFALPNSAVKGIVENCTNKNIKYVWLNNQNNGKKQSTREMAELCREKGFTPVYGICPLMFFPGKGIHKFHYNLKKLFGGLPKEFVG